MKKSVKTAIAIIGAITVLGGFWAYVQGNKDPKVYAIALLIGLALLGLAAFTGTTDKKK